MFFSQFAHWQSGFIRKFKISHSLLHEYLKIFGVSCILYMILYSRKIHCYVSFMAIITKVVRIQSFF